MGVTDCFSGMIRLFLSGINVILLLIGIGITSVSAAIRYLPNTLIEKIKSDNELLNDILNVTAINAITIGLLCLGIALIVVALIGLCGSTFSSKPLLFCYEIILIVVFVAHLSAVLFVVAVEKSNIEDEFRTGLNKTINDLNSDTTDSKVVAASCSALKFLSKEFDCCGANGPQDFTLNTTYTHVCCVDPPANQTWLGLPGCANATIAELNKDMNTLVIANSAFILLEMVTLLFVIILTITKRKNSNRRDDDDDDSMEYGSYTRQRNSAKRMKPTTYSPNRPNYPSQNSDRVYKY